MPLHLILLGALAQLGERRLCKPEVAGSIPARSTHGLLEGCGQLAWKTTYDAEVVALTQLQADTFVTSDGDLARAVSGLVETATIDALRTA